MSDPAEPVPTLIIGHLDGATYTRNAASWMHPKPPITCDEASRVAGSESTAQYIERCNAAMGEYEAGTMTADEVRAAWGLPPISADTPHAAEARE